MSGPYKKLSAKELAKELEQLSSLSPAVQPSTEQTLNVSRAPNHELDERTAGKEDVTVQSTVGDVHLEEEQIQVPLLDLGAPLYKEGSKYSGDIIDEELPPEGKYTRVEIDSSLEFASFFIKNIREGAVTLHDWQKSVHNSLSNAKADSKKPYKFALCACNGSGKDAFIIAIWAVYFCACKIQSRCIVTSSSGTQLTAQTETYIRSIAQEVNDYFKENWGGPIFKINQRFIKCIKSGSEIRLFATDEEGKAEGYHPIEPNAEMCIIVNEAKSVEAPIYRALRRCTGYNYWIDVSSPGQPLGDFYKHFTNWPNKLRVDYTLCPHHSDEERLEDLAEGGIDNAYYRSKWLAYFTSIETSAVIPHELVERIRKLTKDGIISLVKQSEPLRVGIDLAAGGDENVVIAIKGNRIFKKLCFKEKDTTVTAARIHSFLRQDLQLDLKHEHIYADDGGVGHAIIDTLNDEYGSYKWNISRVRNQSAAVNKKLYLNKGAQNWFAVKSIIETNCFMLEGNDDLFFNQLSNRYYKSDGSQGKLALESKAQAKAHGRPSPDRADAFVLALTSCKAEDFNDSPSTRVAGGEVKPKIRIANTPEAIEEWMDKKSSDEYEGKTNFKGNCKRANGSLNSILNNYDN